MCYSVPVAEGYQSGHTGAVLKTVRVRAHGGSNPSPSANFGKLSHGDSTATLSESLSLRQKSPCMTRAGYDIIYK